MENILLGLTIFSVVFLCIKVAELTFFVKQYKILVTMDRKLTAIYELFGGFLPEDFLKKGKEAPVEHHEFEIEDIFAE